MRYVAAPDWSGLHQRHATFASTAVGTTASAPPGPAGLATDPITTATLALPTSYKGCRIMRPSQPDPTVATYEFPVADGLVLMGGPVLDVTFTTTAPDTELSVRLWDVAADGSAQGLVTRGTYRSLDPPGPGRARFQIDPQGYRFPAGHRLKVEVAADDAPYYQQSNVPAIVQVERVELTVPVFDETASAAPQPPERPASVSAGTGARGLPATGGTGHAFVAITVLALGLLLARMRRRLSGGLSGLLVSCDRRWPTSWR
jgi:predicted acyl esterase